MLRLVNAQAQWLMELGVEPGSRMGVCLPNHPDVVVLFLAAMRVGATWVGLAPALNAAEKTARLGDAGASVIFADPVRADELGAMMGIRGLEPIRLVTVSSGGFTLGSESPTTDSRRKRLGCVDPMAPAAIAYTSGSTGFPKGVVHCQEAIALAAEALATLFPPGVQHGACLPLTTLNMLIASALVAFASDGTCSITDERNPKELAAWIERDQVMTFPAVPTLLYDLVEDPDIDPRQLRSLSRPALGGATVDEELCERFRSRFGHEVSAGYGLSEAPGTIARRLPEYEAPHASVGQGLPHVEVSFRDPEGHEVPTGESGEICVGARREGVWADRYVPMLGYWGREDLTKQAAEEGSFTRVTLGTQILVGTSSSVADLTTSSSEQVPIFPAEGSRWW